jgi:dethiobiotin synthetase
MRRIFVTGIGTEVGKTFCSAIIVEALKADYWKPLQSGELDQLDSDFVRKAISNSITKIHPEQYLLSEPMSPHAAANIDGVHLEIANFKVPKTDNNLVIEGAGGLMVPLNNEGEMIVDLIPRVADEVILIVKHYLGSINHTLLSIELLKSRGLNLIGLIFNGAPNEASEKIIQTASGVKCLGRIPELDESLQPFIQTQANQLNIE